MKSKLEKKIDSLEKRVKKLEKNIFGRSVSKKPSNQYKGLVGGINFLIDNGFFKKLRLVTEIHDELKKEEYVYSLQSTDTILRRDFVKQKKALNRINVDGVWQYALRK